MDIKQVLNQVMMKTLLKQVMGHWILKVTLLQHLLHINIPLDFMFLLWKDVTMGQQMILVFQVMIIPIARLLMKNPIKKYL